MSSLRFAIIGFGKMGQIRYDALTKLDGCVVSKAYEPGEDIIFPENLERVGCPEDIINDDSIDAVCISVPNYKIRNYVNAALSSGKHVFCEKPPGMDLADVESMAETIHKTGNKLMFGFNHRHHDSIIEAKQMIDSGIYGNMLWMRGRYGKSVAPDFNSNWRSQKKYAGGGIFLDQGIHMLDLFMHVADGPFEEVKAFVSNLYWKGDVEDNVFALFRNDKGQVASLHSTMTQWRHLFSFEIFLEKGYIVINGLKTSSNTYGKETLSYTKDRSIAPAATFHDVVQVEYSIDNSWKRELGMFIEAIQKDTEITTCGIQDAHHLMSMVEKVYAQ